ncbi:MAG: DUF3810 family protein [Bacteroidales bacterium]
MPKTGMRAVKALLLIAAGVLALVRLPAAWVESAYSRGIYAAFQPVITSVTNQVPFALFDVLAVAATALVLVLVVRAILGSVRRRRLSLLLNGLLNLAVAVAVVYLVFLIMWGLNYQREPVTAHVAFDRQAVTAQALKDMGAEAARQMNVLHRLAHDRGFPSWKQLPTTLGPAFRAVHGRFAPSARPVPGVPKWSVLTPFFERAGVSGMTDPFFLETLVDTDLLPFERPFVAAHEWAHLAGYGDEAEANFLGWLTCLGGDATAAYSGWMYLYVEILGGLPRADRTALARAVDAGPRADLRALAERASRIEPALQAASWQVYDRYLKANRVPEGVKSYSRALVLVLGTRYAPGWKPIIVDR